MHKQYILSIDQSTAGTKALLFNADGDLIARCDRAHEQKISPEGWVSHDATEIYQNTLQAASDVLASSGVASADIAAIGISNQRETALVWDRASGCPLADAVVWQCARAADICDQLAPYAEDIRKRSGLQLSPYFSAAKIAWLLREVGDRAGSLCAGTMDAWLVYKLTGNFKTDWSNASRTQLLNLTALQWDIRLCELFGIDPTILPEICDSNSCFGMSDLGGLLPKLVPVHGVLGDSHAALYGQGCQDTGMTKATYGTGSSVMMNIGSKLVLSDSGVVTSLAWGIDGKVSYVLEGNINYAGAVIKWLVEDVGLIEDASEAGKLALQANPDDTTYLVPAFSGLGAPYWDANAKATISGMTRSTGKAELVRAAENSIALQITDIIDIMRQDAGVALKELRVDGGPTKDSYLMQFQSDIAEVQVAVPPNEELSGTGAAFMAGLAVGIYSDDVFGRQQRRVYQPQMPTAKREKLRAGWRVAVAGALSN